MLRMSLHKLALSCLKCISLMTYLFLPVAQNTWSSVYNSVLEPKPLNSKISPNLNQQICMNIWVDDKIKY